MAQAGGASSWAAEQANLARGELRAPQGVEYGEWRAGRLEELGVPDPNSDALLPWMSNNPEEAASLLQILRYERLGAIQVHGHEYVEHRGSYLDGGGTPNIEGW